MRNDSWLFSFVPRFYGSSYPIISSGFRTAVFALDAVVFNDLQILTTAKWARLQAICHTIRLETRFEAAEIFKEVGFLMGFTAVLALKRFFGFDSCIAIRAAKSVIDFDTIAMSAYRTDERSKDIKGFWFIFFSHFFFLGFFTF